MAWSWADSNVEAGVASAAVVTSGVHEITRCITFETLAADAAGDIKALFRVGAHEIPLEGWMISDAITGASDIDVGFYRGDHSVVDKDALADGLDPSAGIVFASRLDILSALGVHERGVLTMYEIANDVDTGDVIGALPNDSYVIALPLNSEISAAATMTVCLRTVTR